MRLGCPLAVVPENLTWIDCGVVSVAAAPDGSRLKLLSSRCVPEASSSHTTIGL